MNRKLNLLFTVLLAACTLFLTSCDNTKPPSETGDNTDMTHASEMTEALAPEDRLDIPTTADYQNYEFNILSAGNSACHDFDYDEESSIPLDNAQYKRKRRVEENYNVSIYEEAEYAYSSGNGPGFKKISNAVTSGETTYDLALIGGYDVSVLAYSNFLYDMNSVPGIDLTKSWWDQNATDSLGVKGVVFFTTGEITVSRSDAAFCMMFNKTIAQNYRIEDPYEMVRNGTWTLDNFAVLCKTVTDDLNSDSVMDDTDRYGLLVMDDSIVGIVNAAGQRCCTVNADGEIELTLYTESTVTAIEKYLNIIYDTQFALSYQRTKGNRDGREYETYLWSGDHGLFWTAYMGMIPRFREMESDFGILPYPKLSEEQTDYYSTIFPFTSQFICVPLVQDDIERTGIITEALAYYGQQIVTPAYYDVSLIGQSTRDEESSEMLDIIFGNLVYDIGYYYQIGPYNKELIYMVRASDSNFTSRYNTYLPAANALLTVINRSYEKAASNWQ